MKTILTLILSLITSLFISVQAQTWSSNLVTTQPHTGGAYYLKMALHDDTIFIAFTDKGNGEKVNVMKYVNNAWVHVGQPNFSPGEANNLQFDISNGTPWVAFSDAVNGNKATVMRYTGGSWSTVGGAGMTKYIASHLALDVVGGTAYLAYSDAEFNDKATVVKSDGGAWTTVGTPGFTPGMTGVYSLAVSGSTPYFAFRDYEHSYRATVMKYDGSAWVYVGEPGFTPSTHDGNNQGLAIIGGTPYLAARGVDAKATVYKFNGSDWTPTGQGALSDNNGFGLSLAYSNEGVPYVAFGDGNNSGLLSVMRFVDNAWVSMGKKFSSSSVSSLNLAVKSNGTPIVSYNGIIVQEYLGITLVPTQASDNDLRLYPNPNNGEFYLDIPGATEQLVDVGIWSLDGKLVKKYEVYLDGRQSMKIDNLKSGIYLLKATGSSFSVTRKMVVEM